MRIIQITKYVLTEEKYTSFDKVLYIVLLAAITFSIYILGYSFWTGLSINFTGITILGIILLFSNPIYKKYSLPFNQSIGAEYAQKELEGYEKLSKLTSDSLAGGIKTELMANGVIFSTLIIAVASMYLFTIVGFPLSFILVVVLIEILVSAYICIKLWRRIWKPADELQKKQHNNASPAGIALAIIILLLIFAVIIYRYEAITGNSFFSLY